MHVGPTLLVLASILQNGRAPAVPDVVLPREEVHGTVLDRAQQPRAAAEVWLVSRPLPWTEEIGALDVVHARTGPDGAFTARLIAARPYSAWAGWRGREGEAHVTAAAEDVVGGRPVRLAESRLAFGRRLRLTGLDGWTARGPLSARLRPLLKTMWTRRVELGPGHRAALPVVPMVEQPLADLEVLAADGSILASLPAWLTSRSDEPWTVDLGQGYDVPIRVLAAGTNRPIEGALVRRRPWTSPGHAYPGKAWGLLGRTDAEGRCLIRVLAEADPLRRPDRVSESWSISAPGYADALAGCDNGRVFAGTEYFAGPQQTITVRLAAARPLGGRILVAPGRPAANLPVVAAVAWRIHDRPASRPRAGVPLLRMPYYYTATDAGGRFTLPGVPVAAEAVAACVLLSRARCKDLPRWTEGSFPVTPFLAPFDIRVSRPASLGTVDLSAFDCVRLRYAVPGGVSPRPLRLRVHPAGARGGARIALTAEAYTDGRGRAGLLLRRGEPAREYDVLAWAGDVGWALHRVAVPTAGKPLTVPLQAFVTVSGTVVSPEHKRLANAWVRCAADVEAGRSGMDADIARINHDLLVTWTDARGHFELRYLPNPYRPPELIASSRHTAHGPLYRSHPLELGPKPRKHVQIVVDVPEAWLTDPGKPRK